MTDSRPQIKAAVVQAAPVLFNCELTVAKVGRLSAEAAAISPGVGESHPQNSTSNKREEGE